MFNYILYRIGQFVALHLPIKLAYAIAVLSSDLHYIFADKDRLTLTQNLRAIFPEKSKKEIRRLKIRTFRNFAKYLVDFFRFEMLDKDYIKKFVTIKDIRYLDGAMAAGKGVILLTAHIGNWELGGVVLAVLGYPFWAVALPHKYKKVNDFFNTQREIKGVKVIPSNKAVRQSLTLIKENKLVALVGDRDFSREGILVDFFNKTTSLPKGPAAFALKTGAPIVPGFMVRNPDDTFTLQFEKPLMPPAAVQRDPANTNEDQLKEITEQYKVIIEKYILQYPDQWYMFRTFWKEEK